MISFGVIGSGVWGTKVIHAIRGLGFDVIVCNRHGEFESQKCETDYNAVIEASDIIWVATHPPLNCRIAADAIFAGKPTVVEKPVAFNSNDVRALTAQSKHRQVPLIVDYLYLFNAELTGMLGTSRPCKIMVGERHDLHLSLLNSLEITMGNDNPRNQYSALWDWGSHAAAIALDTVREPLTQIAAKNVGDGTVIDLVFGAGVLATRCKMHLSSKSKERVVMVKAFNFAKSSTIFTDDQERQPLQTLISTIARLHLRGEYWTNGDLAVEVTDLLERLHKMLPVESPK